MNPVCGVVGTIDECVLEAEAEAEAEAESRLISSSQASLVHPKISLWMRRCCVLLMLFFVGEEQQILFLFLFLLVTLLVLDLFMAVRSLFCVEMSHFVRRHTFFAPEAFACDGSACLKEERSFHF
jgi:hypothetical protein